MPSVSFKTVKSRIVNVLFWSVVSAAFIGPGTVTTATKAGALFQFDLLWALLFSTFACLLLQEASARIALYSGMNLGQAIAKQFEGKSSSMLVLLLVIGAIILGSAAYETGNILGSIAGISLIFDVPKRWLVVLIGIFSVAALSLPSIRMIAKFMGFVVILMGLAFLSTAIYIQPDLTKVAVGAFVPKMPDSSGAGLLILGLIGTTVVPYDLFLGSGVLDKKQHVNEMRFGLSVAVILGGIISMAVLVVGTIVEVPEGQEFSYKLLADTLSEHVGIWSVYIFGFGMFAAGFSSAITAPLASAITAKSLFEGRNPVKWKTQSLYFKLVWGGVLSIGLLFGLIGVRPIPAIILAQALNGLILPFISIFLIFVVNDSKLMGREGINHWGANILMGIVVWITLIIGLTNVMGAIREAWGIATQKGVFSMEFVSMITLIISLWILGRIYFVRIKRAGRKRLENKIVRENKKLSEKDSKNRHEN